MISKSSSKANPALVALIKKAQTRSTLQGLLKKAKDKTEAKRQQGKQNQASQSAVTLSEEEAVKVAQAFIGNADASNQDNLQFLRKLANAYPKVMEWVTAHLTSDKGKAVVKQAEQQSGTDPKDGRYTLDEALSVLTKAAEILVKQGQD